MTPVEGGVAGTDCDDFDASIRPDAAEVIGDGVDSNCDGTELCYVDADGDGFAAGELTIESADAYCTSVGEPPALAKRWRLSTFSAESVRSAGTRKTDCVRCGTMSPNLVMR